MNPPVAGFRVSKPWGRVIGPVTAAPFTRTTVRAGPSTSVSLASTLPLSVVSSAPVKLSAAATGASSTGVTVTVTVAVAVPPFPSEIVYVNVSVPKKFAAGVYVAVVPVNVTAPFAPWVTPVTVSVSPASGADESFASTATVTGLSSSVVAASFAAVGSSFTGVTVIAITSASDSDPSVVTTVSVAAPL